MKGPEIISLRKQLNITQEELAHTVGVTTSTVNRWENGHASPSKLALKQLRVLNGQRSQGEK